MRVAGPRATGADRRRTGLGLEPGSGSNGPRPRERVPPRRRRSATGAAAAERSGVRRRPPTTSTAAARVPHRESAPRTRSWQFLAAKRAGAVEAIHRSFYARVEGNLKRVRDSVDDFRQSLGLGLGEPAEHVMATGLRSLARRLPDADAKPNEVRRAEGIDDRQHAVVAGARATEPNAHVAHGQVELVVHHVDLLRGEVGVA